MLFSGKNFGFYSIEINGENIPDDSVEISDELYRQTLIDLSSGKIISVGENGLPVTIDPPVEEKTADQIKSEIISAIQQRLDTFAQTRGYDGILSAGSYAGSTIAKFATEGQYCVAARDAHWSAGYAILADVESGVRALPTVDMVLAEMPVLAWPEVSSGEG